MNVLILTSPEYKQFMIEIFSKTKGLTPENVFMDWFNDKFIFTDRMSDWYDVGISFMYTHKVPKEEINRRPWFNFHPAPLPEYKGRDLCYHAIMNGEKEFGATIHYMDEEFDTGDIIEVFRFPLPDYQNAQALSESAIYSSKVLFVKYLPLILETPVFPRIPNKGGTYYKKGGIIEEITVDPKSPFGQTVRAVTYKEHHLTLDIAGVKYDVVRRKFKDVITGEEF